MTAAERPWYAPPRPAWAEPSTPRQPPPPPLTYRQAKRARYKANLRERKVNPEVAAAAAEAAAEAAAAKRIAAEFAAIRADRAAQHREAVDRHYRRLADRRRLGDEW